MDPRPPPLLVLCCLALFAARPARAQSDDVPRDQAEVLYQAGQYADALKAYEAAYARRQSPRLLYLIARTHQRLGHVEEAVSHYRRFLAAEPDAPAALSADAEAQLSHLARLQPLLVPAASPAPLQPALTETRRSKPLIAAGLPLLIGAYVAAVGAGSFYVGEYIFQAGGEGARHNQVEGGMLFIPIVGPFISGLIHVDAVWTSCWIFVDGAAQVAGLTLTILGYKGKRVPLAPIAERLQLRAAPMPGGGTFALSGSF